MMDQEKLRQANKELGQELDEKYRKQTQTQNLYVNLKRGDTLDQVQNAAPDSTDHCVQISTAGHHFLDQAPKLGLPRSLPLFTDPKGNNTQLSSHRIEGFVVPSIPRRIARAGPRNGWTSQRNQEINSRMFTYTRGL